MRKSVKYFFCFLVILALLLFSTLYYISTTLSREDIKSFLISKIEEAMPGTLVSIKKIKYSSGSTLRFEIQDLDVTLRESRPGGELFSVARTFIRVPLWSIFFKGGTIDIIISSPKINYYEYQNTPHNWNLGRKGKVRTVKPQKERPKEDLNETISLPIFLSKSKINLRLDDITIFYQTKEDVKGEVHANTFFVKDISLSRPSFFEIHSSIKIPLPNEKILSSSLFLSGEFDTPNFLEKGLLKLKADILMKDNVLPEVSFSIPDTKVALFMLSKRDKITVKLKLNMGDILDLKTNALLDKAIRLNKFNANLHLGPLLRTSGVHLEGLKLADAKINISGSADLAKHPVWDLKLKTTHDVQWLLQRGPIDIGLLGAINKRQVKLDFLLKTPSGKGVFSVKTTLPRDIIPTSLQDLSQTKMALNLDQIKITQEEIRQLLYSNQRQDHTLKKVQKKSSPKQSPPKQKEWSFIPNFQLLLSGRNIAVGKSPLHFSGLILSANNTLQSKNFSINIGQSKTKIYFTSKIGEDFISTNLDLNMKKVPLESLDFIFPEYLRGMAGVTTTRLKGDIVSDKGGLKHDLNLRSLTLNGRVPNLKMNDVIKAYFNNIPPLKKKISQNMINIRNKFKRLTVNGRFREAHYRVNDLEFIGDKNRVQVKGRGHIFPLNKNQQGVFLLTFKVNTPKVKRDLKRNIGTDTIPIRLAGRGFVFRPDYSYTTKKIARLSAKTQGKKALKKKGNKLLNKHLKKKKKKKAMELLKGLLK